MKSRGVLWSGSCGKYSVRDRTLSDGRNMLQLKIANALKGFSILEDEPVERAFDKVLRSLTVPLSRPVQEVIDDCIERERGISGCMDTGLVLADLAPARGFSSTLILALGVSVNGIRWRWEDGSSGTAFPGLIAHFVLVVLSPDDPTRMRALRPSARIFAAGRAPGSSILAATSLEQAIAIVRAFEESDR